jgi:adenosylcobinamide-phosphate synthase
VFVSATDLVAGVALDLVIGDPGWLPHPVRGVGWFANGAERFWRATRLPLRIGGLLFWLSVVGVFTFLVWLTLPWLNIYWIYALLACRDLDAHAVRVVRALEANDLVEARRRLSWIVGRDTEALDEHGVMRATVETVAENLSDGVIAPLFYLVVAGPAGMAAYKAVNTLDSMVGYRNEQYREFGWASARIDDVANYLPSRLTALVVWIVALLPGFDARRAIRVTLRDGASQPSPNSGYPEAAFAGALGVQLGGLNFYGGKPSPKSTLGDPVVPLARDLYPRVRVLLYASELLFVAVILGGLAWH